MQAEYLRDFLGAKKLRYNIFRMYKAIKSSKVKFDAIAFSGNSGAIIASPLSILLRKPLILVRKTTDDCHSACTLEGCTKRGCRYIIVDDLICEGKTIENVIREVENQIVEPVLVGIFVHHSDIWCVKNAITLWEIKVPIHIVSRRKIIQPKIYSIKTRITGRVRVDRNFPLEERRNRVMEIFS